MSRSCRRMLGMLVAASAALVTAACSSPPPLPAGLSASEVASQLQGYERQSWEAFFPGEPYPDVEPVRSVSPLEAPDVREQCMSEALPGFEGPSGAFDVNDEATMAWLRQGRICDLKYPIEMDDPAAYGYLSEAQARYLAHYYDARVIPCLELLGFSVPVDVSPTFEGESYFLWEPYSRISPQPESRGEWLEIERQCPPSEYGSEFGPPSDLFFPEG